MNYLRDYFLIKNPMKKTLLIAFLALASSNFAFSQVSFAPLDTLQHHSNTGNYHIGHVHPIDFNNDNYDDLIIIKGNSIFLRLNTKNNSFGQEVLVYSDPEHIYSVSNFADINLDGTPDMAIATGIGTTVLFSNDNGLYTKGAYTGTTVSYGRLILTDVDKDNKIDLACTPNFSLVIFSDVNTSGFSSKSTYHTADEQIYDFAIRDLNGDGHHDLVVSTYADKIEVLMGNAAGTLTNVFSKPIESITSIEIADLNLDGFSDIVYMGWNTNAFSLVYNNTTKSFDDGPALFTGDFSSTGFVLMDWKDNGTTDLFYVQYPAIAVLENNGQGNFVAGNQLPADHPVPTFNFRKFNLDNDGIDDFLSSGHNSFQVVSFNANGSIKQSILEKYLDDFWGNVVEDIDQDGFADIVAVSRTGKVYVRWGDAQYTFQNYSELDVPFGCLYTGVTDVNNDGHKDILVTYRTYNFSVSNILVLESNGMRSFDDVREWKYGDVSGSPVIADVEMDGVEDVVVHSMSSNKIVWFASSGNADYEEYFTTTRSIQITGSGLRNFSADDLNADGYVDILTANHQSRDVSILINNKADNFVETILEPNGTVYEMLGVGSYDYNDDGYKDILMIVGHSPGYSVQVFLNDKNGVYTYSESQDITEMYQPEHINVLDIEGDGDQDFVVSAWDYLSTNVFVREGDSVVNLGSTIIANCQQSTRTYADLNGDELVDAFTANFTTGNTYIQLNNSVEAPAHNATVITIDSVTSTTAKIRLNATAAEGRLVVVTKGSAFNAVPDDNVFYSSNAKFGIGAALGPDSHIVLSDTSKTFEITGLTSETTYTISVFEYNVNNPQITIINYGDSAVQTIFTTLNAPPEVAPIDDVAEGKTSVTIDITDSDNELSDLQFEITSSNTDVIPADNITINTTGEQPVIEFTPVGSGESVIEVAVTDPSGNIVTISFTYTVVITGVEEKISERFNVYPNPFSSTVYIESPPANESIGIYDAMGNLIKHYETIPYFEDLSHLPSGLYVFRTRSGAIRKLVKK